MNQWQSWQWPIDDLSELKIERFSYPLGTKNIEWKALLLPSSVKVVDNIWLRRDDELFCVANRNIHLDFVTSGRFSGIRKALDVCSSAIDNKTVARIYFLNELGHLRNRDEESHWAVLVCANGQGAWQTWGREKNVAQVRQHARFRLSTGTELTHFMHRSALDVWHDVKVALSEPESDVSFARKWPQKTVAEREDIVWNWDRSEREQRCAEFQEWLRCVLWKQDVLWQMSEVWNVIVSDGAQTRLFINEPKYGEVAPDELQDDIARLWCYFAPLNNEMMSHDCVSLSAQRTNAYFHVEVQRPTVHEKIEAHLRWQEWLAQTQGDEA